MSQRVNPGAVDNSPKSSAFPIIIVVLLLAAAGVGVWYYMSTRPVVDKPANARTAADAVKSLIADLEDNLKAIEKDPANANDQVAEIKKLADEDINDLTTQVKNAPADVKAKATAMRDEQLPKVQPLVDKVLGLPNIKDQLEPHVNKLMAGLKGLGT